MARSKRNQQALMRRKKMTELTISEPQNLTVSEQPVIEELQGEIVAFDYSSYSEEFKQRSLERKYKIKHNEELIERAYLDIAYQVKAQHDKMSYEKWLEWCQKELGYQKRMSIDLLNIGKELVQHAALSNLPKSSRGLLAIANTLKKLDTDQQSEFLKKYEEEAAAKQKSLTEKEIKELRDKFFNLQKEKETIETQLELTINELSEIRDEKNTLDHNFTELRNQYDDLDRKLKRIEREYNDQQNELLAVDQKIETFKKQYKDELKQEIRKEELRELEFQKQSLEEMIDLMREEKDNLAASIGALQAYQDKSIKNIIDMFNKIEKKLTQDQASVLIPPTPNLVAEYKIIVEKMKLWADVLERALSQVHTVNIDLTENN